MATYVLIHGAWHTGELLEDTAAPIRAAGHEVHLPTIGGNRPGDDKSIGLEEAFAPIADYFESNDITDAVVMGHSYGGMIITLLGDRMPERIRRLVYWNAFVPNSGEALNDMIPPHYIGLFEELAAASGDGSVVAPFPIWREAFINDADYELAEKTYGMLNPHPYKTFADKAKLSKAPAEFEFGKSYLNCRQDTALPHSMPWHPRLSEKLGMFRLVEMDGSHEACFTNPTLLGEKIMEAGRD